MRDCPQNPEGENAFYNSTKKRKTQIINEFTLDESTSEEQQDSIIVIKPGKHKTKRQMKDEIKTELNDLKELLKKTFHMVNEILDVIDANEDD